MKLRHGVRFMDLANGTLWELRTQNSSGVWTCRPIRPVCLQVDCPQKIFREFTEEAICEHVILEPYSPKGSNAQDIKFELAHAIEEATKNLSSHQQRDVLEALARLTRARLKKLGVTLSES